MWKAMTYSVTLCFIKSPVFVRWISIPSILFVTITHDRWHSADMKLHLLRYISDDGFGACLKDQLPLDEGRHRVRGGSGSLLVHFHGYLGGIIVVMAAHGVS